MVVICKYSLCIVLQPRLRKKIDMIQKESRNIIIPAAKLGHFDDDYEKQNDKYYTNIDCGEKGKFYLRQLSENSGSSGHGSYSSDITVKVRGHLSLKNWLWEIYYTSKAATTADVSGNRGPFCSQKGLRL